MRMLTFKQKYAIRFPEFQTGEADDPVDLFSEQGLQQTKEILLRPFDLMKSLTDYVIERNRTRELEKQLAAQRSALDASVEQAAEQKRICLEELSKQLQKKAETEKKELELKLEKLIEETSQKVNDLSRTVEKTLRESQILSNLIHHEREALDSFKPYLERLKSDYSNRKEYYLYCDMERKAYERIQKYLDQMI